MRPIPTRPLPPCRVRGCAELQAEDRRGFCPQHAHLADLESRRGRYRPPATQRGYDRRYRRNRQWVLAEQPLCTLCEREGRVRLAEHVHHAVPLSRGGSHSASNLMPLCRECHERVHREAIRVDEQ